MNGRPGERAYRESLIKSFAKFGAKGFEVIWRAILPHSSDSWIAWHVKGTIAMGALAAGLAAALG